MPSPPATVLVFDSGVGGLTVMAAVRHALPHEAILYLGDTARVPYGTRSADVVQRYAINCARFLADRGAKFLIIACNTAGTHSRTEMGGHSQVVLPTGRPVLRQGEVLLVEWSGATDWRNVGDRNALIFWVLRDELGPLHPPSRRAPQQEQG